MTVRNPEFLSTGCESLDRMLGGGIQRGEVTLIYGEPGTGKTSLATQCALRCARDGLKTIFIDSDNTFSLNRLAQMAGNELDKVSPLIFIFKPQSFHEQSLLIESLESYNLRSIVLIIVDTITSLYSAELGSTEKVFALNMKLNRQLAYLKELARSYNTSVLLISQVRSMVQGKPDEKKIEPVATRVLKFWAQDIINLEATSEPTIKEATLETSLNHGDNVTCFYSLDRSGLVNINREHQPMNL